MDLPIFVDLQGFVLCNKFFVKEVAVMSHGRIRAHYIFRIPKPCWLTNAERPEARQTKHHGLPWLLDRWFQGFVSLQRAKNLIQEAVSQALTETWISSSLDAPEQPVIYVKGLQTRDRLIDLLDDKILHSYIVCLEEKYSSIISFDKISANDTMICNKNHKNCAMRNVCKLANWWIARAKRFAP